MTEMSQRKNKFQTT